MSPRRWPSRNSSRRRSSTICAMICAVVCPAALYCGIPACVFLALLMAVAAPAGSVAAFDSATINCASAYFAMGMSEVRAEYLFAVQIGVDCDVPVLPVLVTSVLGSGVPFGVLSTVRLRNEGSTVAQKFWFTATNTQFCWR